MAATPNASGDELDGAGSASPTPPPPPPPPPHDEADDLATRAPPPQPTAAGDADKPTHVEYRDLFALFHGETADPAQWDHLWQLALVEAREESRVQQLERKKMGKKRGDADGGGSSAVAPTPTRGAARPTGGVSTTSSSGGVNSSADKRPRPPVPGDNDPNKAVRLNRAPPPPTSRPKGGASKLMQKLGGRGS